MRRKIIGVKDFHSSVDITDPCYNKDVWKSFSDDLTDAMREMRSILEGDTQC